MTEKIQTITEIHNHLKGMFASSWHAEEAGAMARLIIEEYTGIGGARQMAFGDILPDASAVEKIFHAAVRASSGEPLQYIFGHTTFCGVHINVRPGVLIPRPETEELTLLAIRENDGFNDTVLDLCTGSGCIAVALSAAFPEAEVHASEKYDTALNIARENATLNNTKVNFIQADILKEDPGIYPASRLIVSNPPYVRESEKKLMHMNVVEHEPHQALFVPDSDPLLFYRAIARIAEKRLLAGGLLYLEINEALSSQTSYLFLNHHFSDVQIIDDIRGKKRFLKARRNG